MDNQYKVLRSLAREYKEALGKNKRENKELLHRSSNDLKMIRPVVLIDEIPWHEMNIDNMLTVTCTDPVLRDVEWFLRSTLYRYKFFPADMIISPYIPIGKCIYSTGNGMHVKENTIATDKKNHIISHQYFDLLQTEEDLERLHAPVITYDKENTMKKYNKVGEVLGDILPVKLKGVDYVTCNTWDDISRYRGVTTLLMELIENPEFMHKIVDKFTEVKLAEIQQYEELGLFEEEPTSLHCTPILSDDLPKKIDLGEKHITRKQVWGRGTAQIFGSVSKEMHDAFDIQYMKRALGGFGLVYYGCCEPLDKKIDIIEKIPNLRKVSITPWADVDIAAEAINTKYVLAAKPNPAALAAQTLDRKQVEDEVKHILEACKRNNCSCELVLKDISTCRNRPQNLFEWEKIVMDLVRNY